MKFEECPAVVLTAVERGAIEVAALVCEERRGRRGSIPRRSCEGVENVELIRPLARIWNETIDDTAPGVRTRAKRRRALRTSAQQGRTVERCLAADKAGATATCQCLITRLSIVVKWNDVHGLRERMGDRDRDGRPIQLHRRQRGMAARRRHH